MQEFYMLQKKTINYEFEGAADLSLIQKKEKFTYCYSNG
jgi:hypothetical protein